MTIIDEPRTRRFNRDEYYKMGDLGFFQDQRVELIDGEIIVKYPQDEPHGPVLEPRPWRFTRAEYYKMADAGLFDGQRVELIDGEIITMSPQNDPHAWAITKFTRWLVTNLSEDFAVRCQLPLAISKRSDPEPDFAVVPTSAISPGDHPKTASLVIEIAHTTLALDRKKAHLYASARVGEYWLVNLRQNSIEVFRRPAQAEDEPFGARYQDSKVHAEHEPLQATTLPLPPLRLADLLRRP